MPIVSIRTNVAANAIPTSVSVDLTNIASECLRKDKSLIWVDVDAGRHLTLGADHAPTAIVGVECIGRLKPGLNLAMGKKIEDWIHKNMGVARNRIVVRFFPQRAQYCVIEGQLLDIKMETDEDEQ